MAYQNAIAIGQRHICRNDRGYQVRHDDCPCNYVWIMFAEARQNIAITL